MAIGNVVGSNVFNVLMIIGVTAMVLPILAIIFFGIYRDSYISSAFIYGQY